MKKTLFVTCLALASSVAQAATLCDVNFTLDGSATSDVTVNINSEWGLTATFNTATPTTLKTGNKFDEANVLCPDINVGNSDKSWTLTFTLTNNGSQNVLITSIDLSMYGLDGSGAYQNYGGGVATNDHTDWIGAATGSALNKPVDVSLTAGDLDKQTLTYNLAGDGDTSSTKEGAHKIGSYGIGSLVLASGESLNLTVEAANNSLYTAGCFAGLGGFTVKGDVVPEPATASLSLLGLAALMMRRRRA